MSKPLNIFYLFDGGGGLSDGFIQEGYEPVAHVEADGAACNTLRTRMAYHWLAAAGREDLYADYLAGEIGRDQLYAAVPQGVIQSVVNDEIRPETLGRIYLKIDSLLKGRELDMFVGGPSCQAYSIVGRSRDPDRMMEDKRNYLYKCYSKFLGKYRPKRFVFENVVGLLSAKDGEGRGYFDAMRRLFHRIGYETDYSTLCAKDYGVLQNRKRVVLVGWRVGTGAAYPEPERWVPDVTAGDVFRDLSPIGAGEGSVRPCRRLPHDSRWQAEAGRCP